MRLVDRFAKIPESAIYGITTFAHFLTWCLLRIMGRVIYDKNNLYASFYYIIFLLKEKLILSNQINWLSSQDSSFWHNIMRFWFFLIYLFLFIYIFLSFSMNRKHFNSLHLNHLLFLAKKFNLKKYIASQPKVLYIII